MKSIKAFALMGVWSVFVGSVLYLAEAHLSYRDVFWAAGIAVTVLVTHMVNMAIYFRVAGNTPFRWFREPV
ncbi:MAG: hypothetical protein AAF270_16415 [Pseudomonadota bacterium]